MAEKTGMEMLKEAAGYSDMYDCRICEAVIANCDFCPLDEDGQKISDNNCNDMRGKALSIIHDRILQEHQAELNDMREAQGLLLHKLEDCNGMMKKPLDKNGKVLNIGDKVSYNGGTVLGKVVAVSDKTVYVYRGRNLTPYSSYLIELVKEQKVYDADGVEIKVGDTVYGIYTCTAHVVTDICTDGSFCWSLAIEDNYQVRYEDGEFDPATNVTLTMRDTQERIDEDTWMDASAYCEKYNVPHEAPKHAGKAKCEHLLMRQRKLDAKKGE